MLLEIYEELQQADLSARIIGCRVGLPVKCFTFPSLSGLALALSNVCPSPDGLVCHWLSFEHGPMRSSPWFWKYTSRFNKQISQGNVARLVCLSNVFPSPDGLVWPWFLVKKGPQGLAPRELDPILKPHSMGTT